MSWAVPDERLELMDLRAKNQILSSKFHILLSVVDKIKDDISDIDDQLENDVPPPLLKDELSLLGCYRRAPAPVRLAVNKALEEYLKDRESLPHPITFTRRSIAANNTKRLLSICEDLIGEYEIYSDADSCLDDLMSVIREKVNSSQEEISTWDDKDDSFYQHIAHILLTNCSSALLESGNYHIYRGQLNPLSCADSLLSVYNYSLRWAVHHGEITKEQYKNEYQNLLDTLALIG